MTKKEGDGALGPGDVKKPAPPKSPDPSKGGGKG
jgi:hypothetical protein